MAFQDFQKHCSECAYGEPCGGGHVYVLSLRDEALQVPEFRDRNPGIEHGADLYLVGWTEHVPRCAASQKSSWGYRGSPQVLCHCGLSGQWNSYTESEERPPQCLTGKVANEVRGRLIKHLNPVEPEDRREVLAELAADLQDQGCGVWIDTEGEELGDLSLDELVEIAGPGAPRELVDYLVPALLENAHATFSEVVDRLEAGLDGSWEEFVDRVCDVLRCCEDEGGSGEGDDGGDGDGEPDWPWPITDALPGGGGGGIDFEHKHSALWLCGYRVGKTEGLVAHERRRFLDLFFRGHPAPPERVLRLFGDEYGELGTEERLRKMANVLASNCRNFKSNDANRYQQAITDYEDDLNYLKAKYYRIGMFPWPPTEN